MQDTVGGVERSDSELFELEVSAKTGLFSGLRRRAMSMVVEVRDVPVFSATRLEGLPPLREV